MYVAQKTSFSATSVTFSLSGSFCAPPRNRGTETKKKSTQTEQQESKKGSNVCEKHEDLITVCDNVLTLYEVWGPSSSFATSSSGSEVVGGLSPEDLAKKGMLRFVASVTLAASPTGVSKIRVGAPSTSPSHDTLGTKGNSNSSSSSALLSPYPDQIVLTFDHEHLSVIAYDAYTCSFVTNALFRLGEQSIVREDVGVPSLLAVDPSNRCIAMLLRRRYLALIPVEPAVPLSSNIGGEQKTTVAAAGSNNNNGEEKKKKVVDNWGDDEDDDEEQNDDVPEADETIIKSENQGGDEEDNDAATTLAPNPNLRPVHTFFGQPKYLDLYSLPERVRNVRDMAFVPSYSGEPTIGFLCEKEPTWAGRAKLIDVAAGKRTANLATCCVSWLVVQSNSLFSSAAANTSPSTVVKKDPASASSTNVVGGNMDPAAFANSPSLQTHQAMTFLVPFNATRLIPCALPNCDAGFLVLAANSVLHLTRTRAAGFYLNDFGKEEATCSTNTKIHWSPLERVSTAANKSNTDNKRIMAETNLTFSDAVATMVGSCRAIVACPLSGLICALDISVSGRNVTGVVCIPITTGAIASSVAVVSATISTASLSDSTPILNPPIVSFFLGSAVGDSIIYSAYSHPQHRRVMSHGGHGDTSDSADDIIIVPPRVFPWIKSIIRNIGPVVGTDIGDFTTPEVGEAKHKEEERQQQQQQDEEKEDKKEKTDDANNEEEEEDEGKKKKDDNLDVNLVKNNANPYEYLLDQTVTPDGPQPFVPLYDVLAASDLVAVGGEGEYGHISFARQSIRPLEVLSQPGDCIAVFVSNPNQSRAESESSNNIAAKKRARGRTGVVNNNHDGENDDDEETKRRLDENDHQDGEDEEESADSKTMTTTPQVLFISYPGTTSVFELSEGVKRLRREEEKEKKEMDVDDSAGAAAGDESGNPQTDDEQKKENGAKTSSNHDDDEDDECPWRTDLRTVWAGAVACRSSLSSSSLSLTTRMIQVTEKTVVIVEDIPFSKKKKRPVRRLVAEIELISSASKSVNANDESVINEQGAIAIDTNEILCSSSSSLRHAFMIANTNLLCATSTAGITYLVDVLNPSVQILNEYVASFLIREAHAKIVKLTEERKSIGVGSDCEEEAFTSLRQQQQEIIDSIAVNGGNVKISSVCDAADAGFGGDSSVSSSDGFIFVSEANSGSLSIIRVTSNPAVEEEGESMNFSCVAAIPSFASLPQAVLNGQPRESDLDVKKPRNTSARTRGGNKVGNAKNNGVIEVTEMLCSSMRSSSSGEKAFLSSVSSVSASTFAFFYALSACGEVAVYKVRASDKSFFKIDQKFVDREFFEEKLESLEEKKKKLNLAEGAQTVQDTTANTKALTQRLVKFSDLTGLVSFSGTRSSSSTASSPLSGVFVCGRRSSVFLSRGGRLVHHHIQTAGPLRGFTEIHAKAISQARFILAGEGFVSYCRLERRMNYLEDWCMRREVIRKTPHFVGYLGPYRSCLVVTSEPVPFRPIRAPFDINVEVTVNGEGQPSEFKVAPRVIQPFIQSESGSVPIPTTDQYSVTLYNAVPFTKLDSITLEENEQVLTSCVGTLFPEHNGLPITDRSGLPHALTVFAVGTAFPLGEDITCRGRLLLIKPSRGTAHASNSGTAETNNDTATNNNNNNSNNGASSCATKKFIQVIHREECKGPVTALTFVRSYLAAAVAGTIKIFSYDSKAERLVTVSFVGAGNFIPKMVAFKDFVLFGDLFNSVTLGKIHSVDKTAYVLAKHAKEFEVSTVDICYKGKELGIIVGGATGHSLLLSYQPQRDGDGNVVGGKLVEEAGAKLSAGIATSARLRIPKNSNKAEFSDETLILYTTAGGEIGCFHPISERISRILAAVNRTMCVAVPQPAGLDPSLFKAIPTEDYSNGIFTSNLMIDGDGVTNFMLLSFSDRTALAAAAKVSQDRVLNALCGLSEQSFLIL